MDEELGKLDMREVDRLHNKLMNDSPLYKEAARLKLAGLMSYLLLKEHCVEIEKDKK